MHFFDAMELAAHAIEKNLISEFFDAVSHLLKKPLPPPVSSTNNSPLVSLRFGFESRKHQSWAMNFVTCKTSYDPVMLGKFDSIVQSGMLKQPHVLDDRN